MRSPEIDPQTVEMFRQIESAFTTVNTCQLQPGTSGVDWEITAVGGKRLTFSKPQEGVQTGSLTITLQQDNASNRDCTIIFHDFRNSSIEINGDDILEKGKLLVVVYKGGHVTGSSVWTINATHYSDGTKRIYQQPNTNPPQVTYAQRADIRTQIDDIACEVRGLIPQQSSQPGFGTTGTNETSRIVKHGPDRFLE